MIFCNLSIFGIGWHCLELDSIGWYWMVFTGFEIICNCSELFFNGSLTVHGSWPRGASPGARGRAWPGPGPGGAPLGSRSGPAPLP